MATQLDRRRRAPGNKLTELQWEHDDTYTLTPADIANGWFEHQLIHPRINYELFVRCRVNAFEYSFDSMIVDETTGLVHVTLGGWETEADIMRFQYYYRHGGKLVVPADPPPPEYAASQRVNGWYFDAPDPAYSIEPRTLDLNMQQRFTWYGDFSGLNITGFKLVGEFSGNGTIYCDWWMESPDPGTGELWPEPDNGYWSLVGLIIPDPGWVVNGTNQVFEHVYATTNTTADPAYSGYDIATPLQDLLISLNEATHTYPYPQVYGHVDHYATPGEVDTTITIHRLDLVLIGS